MITDTERMNWLTEHCSEKYLTTASSEFEDTRMVWVMPTLISTNCINTRVPLRESIDEAILQKRRRDDRKD